MIDVVRRTAGGKLKLIRRLDFFETCNLNNGKVVASSAENVYSWIYIMDNGHYTTFLTILYGKRSYFLDVSYDTFTNPCTKKKIIQSTVINRVMVRERLLKFDDMQGLTFSAVSVDFRGML